MRIVQGNHGTRHQGGHLWKDPCCCCCCCCPTTVEGHGLLLRTPSMIDAISPNSTANTDQPRRVFWQALLAIHWKLRHPSIASNELHGTMFLQDARSRMNARRKPFSNANQRNDGSVFVHMYTPCCCKPACKQKKHNLET